MSQVAVVTDSCACVLPELIEELDVKVVPYYVHREGQMLKDVEIDYDEFFDYLATTQILPTTANPGAGEYLEAFEQAFDDGANGIVAVTMTADGSGAYEAAMLGGRMFNEKHPDVSVGVCDTRNVSGAHFLFAVEGARAARRGADVSAIMALWQRMIPATHLVHTAPSLDYLYRGGRIGRAKHMVATLLKIKPIITMKDGIIEPLAQVRTRTMDKVYKKMIEIIRADVGDAAIKVCFVHTTAHDLAEQLQDMVRKQLNVVEAFIAPMSPALGVHVGPDSVSVSYVPLSVLSTPS